MAAYQLTNTTSVLRTSDGVLIPNDPRNYDYAQYLAWVNAGNTADPYVPPAQTADEIRADTFKGDPGRADLMTRLKTATPAQIDTWIDANVTTIAQARTLFKAILKAIALDARN